MHGFRGDLEERHQREGSFEEAGVRERQVRLVQHDAGDEEQVEIERARTPAFAPDSAVRALYLEEQVEKPARLERRANPDGGVQVARLRWPHGRRFPQSGNGDHLGTRRQRPESRSEGLRPCPQIGSEPDDGVHALEDRVSFVEMLGLSFGEAFVTIFIVVTVVSAPLWPRAGAAVARALQKPGSQRPPGDG